METVLAEGNVLQESLERSAKWRFFHDLFRPPCEEQIRWLHEPRVKIALDLLCHHLEVPVSPAKFIPKRNSDYEETYLCIFEVGFPHPLCPLIESHWNQRDPIPKILHENILFYKQFGLEPQPTANETVDHLRFQLEFLVYLYQLQSQCMLGEESSEHVESITQARKDFLERHLCYWLPLAVEALQEKKIHTWPYQWLNIVNEYAQWELNGLRDK